MDECINLLRDTLLLYNSNTTIGEWFEMMHISGNKETIEKFLNSPNSKVLLFSTYNGRKKINVLNQLPSFFSHKNNTANNKGLLVYFFKLETTISPVNVNNIRHNMVSGSLSIKNNFEGKIELLKYFQNLMSNVYIKAVSDQLVKDHFLWEDELVEEVVGTFQIFHETMDKRIKNLQNEIVLPLPFTIENFNENELSSFVTLYENYVTQWWQIMESIQSDDFLSQLKVDNGNELKIIKIIDGYQFKMTQIQLIFKQLENKRAQHILDTLRDVESPFYSEHTRHVMRISIALEDSKDCLKFLQPLRPILRTWQQLARNNKDFKSSTLQLLWIFRSFSNIWQLSKYYSNTRSMTSLIRHFLNDVINVISDNVDASLILNNNSTLEIQKIRLAIKTCKILHAFYDKECKYLNNKKNCDKTWKVLPKKSIFSNIEMFQERCVDLLYVSDMFNKFESLPEIIIVDSSPGKNVNKTINNNSENGGIGKKVLQIHDQFKVAKSGFLNQISGTDTLNPVIMSFENAFILFKKSVSECEKKLSQVLSVALGDVRNTGNVQSDSRSNDGIETKTKSHAFNQLTQQINHQHISISKAFCVTKALDLIQSFDTFMSSPSVKKVCEIALLGMVEDVRHEVGLLSNAFAKQNLHPHVPENVPQYSGCILWARTLIDRANEPYHKILQRCPQNLKEDASIKLLQIEYTKFKMTLDTYIETKHSEFTLWLKSTIETSNLRGNLLRRLGVFSSMQDRAEASVKTLKEAFFNVLENFMDDKNAGLVNNNMLNLSQLQQCIQIYGIKVDIDTLRENWVPSYFGDFEKRHFSWDDVYQLWSVAKFDVRIAFQTFDEDGSGYIDRKEFSDMLHGMGVSFTATQFQQAVSQLDPNNDGIDFDEFYGWWSNFQDHSAPKLLEVNVDPQFVWLLKELRYFQLMKMEIPSEAEYLMSFESSFRKHKAQLGLIVTLYNGMHVTLLPVERPLLYERMLPIESLIEKAVSTYKWDSISAPGDTSRSGRVLQEFLSATLVQLSDCVNLLQILKNNLRKMETVVIKWAQSPLVIHSFSETQPLDLRTAVETINEKLLKIAKDNEVLHSLFEDTRKTLGSIIKKQQPRPPRTTHRKSTPRKSKIRKNANENYQPWEAYVNYWNLCLLRIIKSIIRMSMMHILTRLGLDEDGNCMSESPENKIFEIKMSFRKPSTNDHDMDTKDIMFSPRIQVEKENESGRLKQENIIATIGTGRTKEKKIGDMNKFKTLSFVEQLNVFFASLLKLGSCFKKFSNSSNATFMDDVAKDKELDMIQRYIFEHLSKTFVFLHDYKRLAFSSFEFLWKCNPKRYIKSFVQNTVNVDRELPLLVNQILGFVPKFVRRQIEDGVTIAREESETIVRKAVSNYESIKELFETVPKLECFVDFMNNLKNCKLLIMAIDSEKNYHGFRLHTKYAQSIVVSLIDQWMAEMTNYLNSYIMQRVEDVNAFANFFNLALSSMSTDWSPGKYGKDDLGLAFGYVASFKNGNSIYKSVMKTISDIVTLLRAFNVELSDSWKVNIQNAPLKWIDTNTSVTALQIRISKVQSSERELFFDRQKAFITSVEGFQNTLDQELPLDYFGDINVPFSLLDKLMERLVSLKTNGENINVEETMFELEISNFHALQLYTETILACQHMWEIISYCEGEIVSWVNQSLRNVTIVWESAVKIHAKDLRNHLLTISKYYAECNASFHIKSKIKAVLSSINIILALKSAPLRKRHLQNINQAFFPGLELHSMNDDVISCKTLYDFHIYKHIDELEKIMALAVRQHSVERALKNISKMWTKAKLEFSTSSLLQPRIDFHQSLFEKIEDHRIVIESILNGQNGLPFVHIIKKWKLFLRNANTILSRLSELQALSFSLVCFFPSSSTELRQERHIQKIQAKVTSTTSNINEFFLLLKKDPSIYSFVTTSYDSSIGKIEGYLHQLYKYKHELLTILDGKRRIFSRFCFIDNISLMTFLSSARLLSDCQPLLRLIFPNVHSLILKKMSVDGNNKRVEHKILGVKGHNGEMINFESSYVSHVDISIENKLQAIQRKMCLGIHNQIIKALRGLTNDTNFPYGVWLMKHCTQSILISTSILFARHVDIIFKRGKNESTEQGFVSLLSRAGSEILETTLLIRSQLRSANRGKCIDLLLMKIHHRDVLKRIQKIVLENDGKDYIPFEWDLVIKHKVMKYSENYSKDTAILTKNMKTLDEMGIIKTEKKSSRTNVDPLIDSSYIIGECFEYASPYMYEFVPSGVIIVNYPLTERTTLAMTQIIKRGEVHPCISGFRGSGKTSLLKYTSCMFGRLVRTFSASNSNIQMMTNFIIGTMESGAWSIVENILQLDEQVFNCLSNVLSTWRNVNVFERINVNGVKVDIHPFTFSIAITIPPKGVSNLQKNKLKKLFKIAEIGIPNLMKICSVLLSTEGFHDCEGLGRKLCWVMETIKATLDPVKSASKGFGLVLIGKIINLAGILRRELPQNEDACILNSIQKMFGTRVESNNIKSIQLILSTAFDTASSNELTADSEFLKQEAHATISAAGLHSTKTYVDSLLDFHSLLSIQKMIILLGPSRTGKSQLWRNLSHLNERQGIETRHFIVPVKALSVNEIYGSFNTRKQKWVDGLLTSCLKQQQQQSISISLNPYWVILDGDIDPSWCSPLESSMSKSNKLTLGNSYEISVNDNVKYISESTTLRHADPSTISRAGIYCIRSFETLWSSQLYTWLQKLTNVSKQVKQNLQVIGESIFAAAYLQTTMPESFLHQNNLILPISFTTMVDASLLMLKQFLSSAPSTEWSVLCMLFVHSIVWGMGKYTVQGKKALFDVWVKGLRESKASSDSNVSNGSGYPSTGLCFDWVLTFTDDNSILFISWRDFMKLKKDRFCFTDKSMFENFEAHNRIQNSVTSQLYLPSSKIFKSLYLLSFAPKNDGTGGVCLIGKSLSGKTTVMNMLLKYQSSMTKNSIQAKLNAVPTTMCHHLFKSIEPHIEDKTGKVFAPRTNHNLLFFIDDLHLQSKDQYGSSSIASLLRHYLQYEEIFHPDRYSMVNIKNMSCFITCEKAESFSLGTDSGDTSINRVLDNCFAVQHEDSEEADLGDMFNEILVSRFTFCYHKMGSESSILLDTESYEYGAKTVVNRIIDASSHLFLKLQEVFQRRERESPYKFNLGMYVKAMLPLASVYPSCAASPYKLVRLWLHLCRSVYVDSLETPNEQEKCNNLISSICQQHIFALSSENNYEDHDHLSSDEIESFISNDGEQIVQIWSLIGRDKVVANKFCTDKLFWRKQTSEINHKETAFFEGKNGMDYAKSYLYKTIRRYDSRSGQSDVNLKISSIYIFDSFVKDFSKIYEQFFFEKRHIELVDPGGCGDRMQCYLICNACGFYIYDIGHHLNVSYGKVFTDLAINLIENTNRNLALIVPSYDKRAEEFVSICIEIMSGQVFESIFETKQNYQCVHDSLMKRYGTSDIANLKSIFSSKLRFMFCRSQQYRTSLNLRKNSFSKLHSFVNSIVLQSWSREAMIEIGEEYLKRQDYHFEIGDKVDIIVDNFVLQEVQEVPTGSARQKLNISRVVGDNFKNTYNNSIDEFHLELMKGGDFNSDLIIQLVDGHMKAREIVTNSTKLKEHNILQPIDLIYLIQSAIDNFEQKKQQLLKRLELIVLTCCKVSTSTGRYELLPGAIILAKQEYEDFLVIFKEKLHIYDDAVDSLKRLETLEIESVNLQREYEEELNTSDERIKEGWLKAQPIQQAAQAYIDRLNKKDLTELKSFKNPPEAVRNVMKVLLLIFNEVHIELHTSARSQAIDFKCDEGKEDPLAWQKVQKLMINLTVFLKQFKEFPLRIDNIEVPRENFKSIEKYLKLKTFDEKSIRRKSKAAAGIFNYIVTLKKYHDAFLLFQPLRERVVVLKAEIERIVTSLKNIRKRLSKQRIVVQNCFETYSSAKSNMDSAALNMKILDLQLEFATKNASCLKPLEGEWYAWLKRFKHYEAKIIYGNSIMAANLCTNANFMDNEAGECFIHEFIERKLNRNGFPTSKEVIEGIPGFLDHLILNKYMLLKSLRRLPFSKTLVEMSSISYHEKYKWICFIDSYEIAFDFVVNLNKGGGGSNRTVHEISYASGDNIETSRDFLRKAIREGMYVFINLKSCSIFPDELLPLISYQRSKTDVFNQKKKVDNESKVLYRYHGKKLNIFGNTIDVHPDFQFCIRFKQLPCFPNKQALQYIKLINLQFSAEALGHYFVDKVYQWCNPRQNNIYNKAWDKIFDAKHQIENNKTGIYQALAYSGASWMLDNELLENVINFESRSKRINSELKTFMDNMQVIQNRRKLYGKIGQRITICFQFLNKLENKNKRGNNTILKQFAGNCIFNVDGVKLSVPDLVNHNDDVVVERKYTEQLNAYITKAFTEACTSHLEEKIHTKMFYMSFFCHITAYETSNIGQNTLNLILFLMNDFSELDFKNAKESPLEWLPTSTWKRITEFSRQFDSSKEKKDVLGQGDIGRSLLEEGELWKEWFNAINPELIKLPVKWHESTNFEKLCIVKLLRPDRFPQAIDKFLEESMLFQSFMDMESLKDNNKDRLLFQRSQILTKPITDEKERLFRFAIMIHYNVLRRRNIGRCGWNMASLQNSFNDANLQNSFEILQKHGLEPVSKYLISKLNYGSVIYDLHDGNVLQLLIEECLENGEKKNKCFRNDEMIAEMLSETTYENNCFQGYEFQKYLQKTAISIMNKKVLDDYVNRNDGYNTDGKGRSINRLVSAEFFTSLFAALPQITDILHLSGDGLMLGEIFQPYLVFFEMEIGFFNRCIHQCKKDLTNLESYSNNTFPGSNIDNDLKTSILNWRTPKSWLKNMTNISEQMSLSEWFRHLQEMKSFHVKWVNEISNGFPIPQSMPLNLIIYKDFFLFCIKMVFAKKHNVDVVNVAVNFYVDETSVETKRSKEKEEVNLTGIFLEGASWDFSSDRGITDFSKSQIQSDFPVICAKPLLCDQDEDEEYSDEYSIKIRKKEDEDNIYYCPLYATRNRDGKLLGHIKFQTIKPYKFWLFKGVGAICEQKYV